MKCSQLQLLTGDWSRITHNILFSLPFSKQSDENSVNGLSIDHYMAATPQHCPVSPRNNTDSRGIGKLS